MSEHSGKSKVESDVVKTLHPVCETCKLVMKYTTDLGTCGLQRLACKAGGREMQPKMCLHLQPENKHNTVKGSFYRDWNWTFVFICHGIWTGQEYFCRRGMGQE